MAIERHRLTAGGRRLCLDDVDEVVVGRDNVGGIERQGRTVLLLVGDIETSRKHLVIRRTEAGWSVEDLGSRNGTVVNGERVDRAMLVDGDWIEAGGAVLQFSIDHFDVASSADGSHGPPLRREAASELGDRDLQDTERGPRVFQTLNLDLEDRIAQVERIAASRVPVLVRGETGTGKELMARAIHAASGRPGAFVAVNCGALPRTLIESELFGYRKGAFSGADEDRDGLFRRAHRGTLFLDEVAELAAESQSALLRVLQEGEVRPVGASEPIKVDVRIIAASHQDLAHRMVDGRFRQDLYGRISGFEITMPPLRHRRADLGTLIASILPRLTANPERISLHRDAACALMRYPWPQNIRELEQALGAAVALCDDGRVRLGHLPGVIANYRPPGSAPLSARDAALRVKLVGLLEESSGNVAAVARAMTRAPVQIRRWCRRLKIDLARYRQ